MNTYRKILIFVILLTMLTAGCSTQAGQPPSPVSLAPTPTMAPLEVIKAYESAFNRHDVLGAMVLLADDVSFLEPSWGNMEVKTWKEVIKVHDFYFGTNIKTNYNNCMSSANTVICNLTYAEDCSRAFGIDVIPGKAVFTLLKDKIQTISWDTTSPELDHFVADYDKFTSWWEKTYPDEFNSGDEWLSRKTGTTLGKRCQEYGATQQ